ncbi:MAG: phage replisome organizer N-terminal domain-containing protein [Lachnospiraceae bacterium]|nr:phage replisome organizer N-terminal domain-containing protein [Lachnospiraceae bacterium]
MDGVKWFKMYVGFHNNRKIKQLVQLPNGTDIITVWVFLLDLAAEVNDDGMIYFTKEIPYTDEMLVAEMGLSLPVIRQALYYLDKFEMIETVDDIRKISNWSRYQNVASIDRVREQTKLRTRAWRERKKLEMKDEKNSVTEAVTSQKRKCDDVEEESEKEEDKKHSLRECNAPARANVYGVYQNVTLTDDALAALRMDFPTEWQRMIDNLSTYMQTHGTEYADHAAVMRKWAAEDAKKKKAKPGSGGNAFGYEAQREYSSEEMDELELKMRLRRTGDQEGGGND